MGRHHTIALFLLSIISLCISTEVGKLRDLKSIYSMETDFGSTLPMEYELIVGLVQPLYGSEADAKRLIEEGCIAFPISEDLVEVLTDFVNQLMKIHPDVQEHQEAMEQAVLLFTQFMSVIGQTFLQTILPCIPSKSQFANKVIEIQKLDWAARLTQELDVPAFKKLMDLLFLYLEVKTQRDPLVWQDYGAKLTYKFVGEIGGISLKSNALTLNLSFHFISFLLLICIFL